MTILNEPFTFSRLADGSVVVRVLTTGDQLTLQRRVFTADEWADLVTNLAEPCPA